MITFKNLGIRYGGQHLFDQVNLLLTPGNRYAITGANGAGKSTLLRLMMKVESPSEGEILTPKDKSIGWVKQDHFIYDQCRVLDVVIQGKRPLWNALQEKEKLLEGDWRDEDAHRLIQLEEIIAHYDGYSAEGLAHTFLEGLGIPLENHLKPMHALSGGYKMRVLLAQALFETPDILLLDEPSNHLDIMTIYWLEQYLINDYKGLLVFVSHDIKFLKSVSTHILDIDYGEIFEYPGSYDRFLARKTERMEQKRKELESVKDKIADMQDFVDRFKAKASKARQAQSRVKMIEKMEIPEIKQSSRQSPAFAFIPKRPSGKIVLEVQDIYKSFGPKTVLKNINFKVNRHEKIAIIGHNGIGKSTLLKIMLDVLPADQGKTTWGHETHVAYFAQDHHEMLHEDVSVFHWLSEQFTAESPMKIRAALSQVLFTKDDVEKASFISVEEKLRVCSWRK